MRNSLLPRSFRLLAELISLLLCVQGLQLCDGCCCLLAAGCRLLLGCYSSFHVGYPKCPLTSSSMQGEFLSPMGEDEILHNKSYHGSDILSPLPYSINYSLLIGLIQIQREEISQRDEHQEVEIIRSPPSLCPPQSVLLKKISGSHTILDKCKRNFREIYKFKNFYIFIYIKNR